MTIDSSLSSIFPAPWQDRVSQQVPITITDALYWCEYVALANQHLASALRKLAAFFVTEVRVMGAGSEEERIKDFLYDVLNIENVLNSIALDYLVYGNAFVTIFNPVERVVSCPRCKFGTLFLPYASRDDTKFRFQGGKFHLYCVKCHYVGPWDTYTVSNTRPEDINIIRWNVHDILIDDDLFSGKCRYTMRAPQAYVAKIKSGGPLQLAHIPDEFLTAALTDQHFVFNDDAIIHIKEPALAGLQMGGWGLSPILANFRQTWYIEVLRRANMAVAYDYIVPLRIIAPEPRSVGPEFGDPTLISNMSSVSSSLQAIIADWRQDPTGWYSCPFPIRYQVMGAEAGKVMPAPLIEQGNRDLIAGLSLPVEFFYGNLAMNAAPDGPATIGGHLEFDFQNFELFPESFGCISEQTVQLGFFPTQAGSSKPRGRHQPSDGSSAACHEQHYQHDERFGVHRYLFPGRNPSSDGGAAVLGRRVRKVAAADAIQRDERAALYATGTGWTGGRTNGWSYGPGYGSYGWCSTTRWRCSSPARRCNAWCSAGSCGCYPGISAGIDQ